MVNEPMLGGEHEMGSIARFPLRDTRIKYTTAPADNSYARNREAKPKDRGREGRLFGLTLGILTFAGWCQHLYTCVLDGNWGFLIAGAVITPIGIFNGWGIWLGWW